MHNDVCAEFVTTRLSSHSSADGGKSGILSQIVKTMNMQKHLTYLKHLKYNKI